MVSEFEKMFSAVFMYAAGTALLAAVIGVAIMVGMSIYDIWRERHQ